MNRSQFRVPARSVVPPGPAEVAVAGVGWRRVGLLQRLVKLERDSLSLGGMQELRSETARRRAA